MQATNLELTEAKAQVTKARAGSDRGLDQTLQTVEDYYTGVGEELLLGQKEFRALRDRLLEKPRAFYEQLARELESNAPPDERIRYLLAKGRHGLARISYTLGQQDAARKQFEEAIGLFRGSSRKTLEGPRTRRALASV